MAYMFILFIIVGWSLLYFLVYVSGSDAASTWKVNSNFPLCFKINEEKFSLQGKICIKCVFPP